jgi:hypothetical protein
LFEEKKNLECFLFYSPDSLAGNPNSRGKPAKTARPPQKLLRPYLA